MYVVYREKATLAEFYDRAGPYPARLGRQDLDFFADHNSFFDFDRSRNRSLDNRLACYKRCDLLVDGVLCDGSNFCLHLPRNSVY